jgi:hypothetical protein
MYKSSNGAKQEEPQVCSICLAEYSNYGNNAWPFAGRCCDECDARYVNPVRLTRFRKWAARSERRHTAA